MALNYVPPQITIKGPWILTDETLAGLDKLLLEIETKLAESHKKEILEREDSNIGEGKKYENDEQAIVYNLKHTWSDEESKKITLISEDRSQIVGKTIREIQTSSKSTNFKPSELIIEFEYGRYNFFRMTFQKLFSRGVEYKIHCTQSNIQDDLNFTVNSWISKHKPKRVSQFWKNNSFVLSFPTMILSLVLFIIFLNPSEPDSREFYKDQINSLIESGVNEDNQSEAVELILKLNSNYLPEGEIQYDDRSDLYWKIGLLLFIIAILANLPPKNVIGIGLNRRKAYRMIRYTEIVIIGLPTVIFLPLIYDLLKAFWN